MFFKRYKDAILGAVTLLLGIGYLLMTQSIKLRFSTTFANARFMPTILGILMLVLGALILMNGIKKAKAFKADGQALAKTDFTAVLETFALIVAYVAVMQWAGFLLSTMIYLFLQMMILAPKDKRKPVVFFIVSVGFTAIVYYAFRYGLDLMLPQGILDL